MTDRLQAAREALERIAQIGDRARQTYADDHPVYVETPIDRDTCAKWQAMWDENEKLGRNPPGMRRPGPMNWPSESLAIDSITIGDLRRAREALALLQSGPDTSRQSSETADDVVERFLDQWELKADHRNAKHWLIGAITAALDAAAEGQGWQDMASAPKDGTQVLLYFPLRYRGTGGISWGCFINGEWLDSQAFRDNDATHWRPLPAPPVSVSKL